MNEQRVILAHSSPHPDYLGIRTGANCCALSPNGEYALSGGEDGKLKLWSTATWELIHEFEVKSHRKTHRVYDCSFSPYGSLAAAITREDPHNKFVSLSVWSAPSAEWLWGTSANSCCSFSHKGTLASAWAYQPPTLKIFEAATGILKIEVKGHTDAILGCTFNKNGTRIITTSRDETIRIWDTQTGQLLYTLKEHQSIVGKCILSKDDRLMVSAGWDGKLIIWDMNQLKPIRFLLGHEQNRLHRVCSCHFTSDDKYILSASWDRTLRLWETETGKQLQVFEGHEGGVNDCAVAPDDSFMLLASNDGTLRVWTL